MDEYEEKQKEKISKMTFKELSNMPIFKANKKRIFEDALNLAIKSNTGVHKLDPKIIEFRVHYVTSFGQEVCMIGSIGKLGGWNAESKSVQMKWNQGHLWTIQFQVSELEKLFEFKFVIKEGSNLIRWEEGHNHIYDYNKMCQRLRQPHVLKQIEEGKFDAVEVETDKDKTSYNRKTKVLALHTLWQAN